MQGHRCVLLAARFCLLTDSGGMRIAMLAADAATPFPLAGEGPLRSMPAEFRDLVGSSTGSRSALQRMRVDPTAQPSIQCSRTRTRWEKLGMVGARGFEAEITS